MDQIADLTQAIESKIDRSTWQTRKFSDLAENIVEKVVPRDSSLKHYIGLEHLDSGSLHIKRFGETASLVGDKLRIYKGDLIFAKRNAYLKRVAIAEFDAVASAHSLVLRAKPENVLPEFLPFFMLSETFWEKAIEISVGSLSPTINWKALAKQEFMLPKKDQQVQLAKLLWAFDEVISSEIEVLYNLHRSKCTLFQDEVYEASDGADKYFGTLKSKHNVEKLGKLLKELQYGISENLSESGAIPVLRMNNLQGGLLDLRDLKYYSPRKNELHKFILDKGDVLFNRTNSFDLVGKVSLFNQDGKFSFASYLIRLKTDSNKLDPRYLNFFLNSAIGMAKIRKYRTPGVSQSNINAQNLKYIPIPLPHIGKQLELMDKIEKFESGESLSRVKISNSKFLQKILINQIF